MQLFKTNLFSLLLHQQFTGIERLEAMKTRLQEGKPPASKSATSSNINATAVVAAATPKKEHPKTDEDSDVEMEEEFLNPSTDDGAIHNNGTC